jgi:hypothetical protein
MTQAAERNIDRYFSCLRRPDFQIIDDGEFGAPCLKYCCAHVR